MNPLRPEDPPDYIGGVVYSPKELQHIERHVQKRIAALAAGQATAAQQPGVAYAALPEPQASHLKSCPCGATPDALHISGEVKAKWAFVSGSCCGEWSIEYRNNYADLSSPEAMELATTAWNEAPRASHGQAPQQSGVGNSGFDHKTAADFLNGKTVSDEAVRKFVAASRWAHDDRASLQATLQSVRNELASREAEIALLKTALMNAEEAAPTTQPAPGEQNESAYQRGYMDGMAKGRRDVEAAPQQEAQEPVAWLHTNRLGEVQAFTNEPPPSLKAECQELYTAPQPSPAAQGDALDAARLDWLTFNLSGKALRDIGVVWSEHGDARRAIDAARAAQEGK